MTMPSQCSICGSKDRFGIEEALVTGRSLRSIEREFAVSRSAISRHQHDGHIGRTLRKAVSSPVCPPAKREEIVAIAQASELVKWTRGLLGKSLRILDSAEGGGDLRTACAAVREARGNVELLAKLTGELSNASQLVQNNNGISPEEYRKTIGLIIRALEPFTDARAAVLNAIGAAEVIDVVENE